MMTGKRGCITYGIQNFTAKKGALTMLQVLTCGLQMIKIPHAGHHQTGLSNWLFLFIIFSIENCDII